MKSEDIDNRFAFHAATTPEKRDEHTSVRQHCRRLAEFINENVPEGREKSLAITHCEEAMLWANAALARHLESPRAGHTIELEHGNMRAYNYGCRCEGCRAANAARGRAQREKASGRKSRGLLSSDEAADMLGVTRHLVGDEARRGNLPFTRVGSRLRFAESDIRAYIDQRTTGRP